jgi:hypothetical protein
MALTDYDKYSLLLPFNEADESTTVIDYSPRSRTLILVGNAKVDDAIGYPTLLLDGSGDYGQMENTDAFDLFSAGVQATIECRFNILGNTALESGNRNACLFEVNFPGSGTFSDCYGLFVAGSTNTGDLGVYFDRVNTSGSSYLRNIYYDSTITQSAEHHLSLNRISDGSWVAYLDGTAMTRTQNQIGTTNFSHSKANNIKVGRLGYSGALRETNGRIRDLIVVRGVALRSGNFSPPAGGSLVKTFSGNVKDDTNANTARVVQAISRQNYNGRPVAFSTTSDGSTGNYSLKVPDIGSEEWTRLFLDDISGTVYNDLVLGRGTPA